MQNAAPRARVVVPFSPVTAWIYSTRANMLTGLINQGQGLLFRLVQGQHGCGLTLGGLEVNQGQGLSFRLVQGQHGFGLTLGGLEVNQGQGLLFRLVQGQHGFVLTLGGLEVNQG